MSGGGKREANLRCKLYQYDSTNQWKSFGVGFARLQQFGGQWLTIFSAEDGSESAWDVRPETEFCRDDMKVIRFYCTRAKKDHALSFQFEEGAATFWAQVQKILDEYSRVPLDTIPLLTEDNLHDVVQKILDFKLSLFFLIESKDHYYSMLHLFDEMEKKYRTLDNSITRENLQKFQTLVDIVLILCKLKIILSAGNGYGDAGHVARR